MAEPPWSQYDQAFKRIWEKLDALTKTLTSPPNGKKINKIGFWEDSDGNIKYVKFYEGAEELFVLTFSNAGDAPSETWNVTRS